jgi:hypothetical protein
MAKKGIMGHDEWVATEALATTLIALEQLLPKHQRRTHMEDLKKLLAASGQPGSVPLHLARRRVGCFPTKTGWRFIKNTALRMGRADGLRPAMHQCSITSDLQHPSVVGANQSFGT